MYSSKNYKPQKSVVILARVGNDVQANFYVLQPRSLYINLRFGIGLVLADMYHVNP